MGDSNFGTWIFAFLIVAVIFGWGGIGGLGGGNAAAVGYATMADVNSAINNQTIQSGLNQIALSSANNNYETAQLITNQNNTNLINAIQGFNNLGLQIMNQTNTLGTKLDQIGYQMENCCCSIKTLIKDNQIADLTNQVNQSNTIAAIQAQSEYLLGQTGKWVANAPAAAAAYTAAK